MIKPIYTFLFLSLCVASIGAFSQQQGPAKLVLYHLSEKNGLSDNVVNCFYQDSKGIMWIGTQDGLNSYDASAFKQYQPVKDSSGFAGRMISAIKEDANSNIWITSEKGLAMLDRSTETIHCFADHAEPMNEIAPDSKGNLWIGTSAGLLQFNIATRHFTRFYNSALQGAPGRRSNHITGLAIMTQDIWMGTAEGLWRFSLSDHRFIPVQGTEGLVMALHVGHDGLLWLGYWAKGLSCFDTKTGAIKNYMPGMISGISETGNKKDGYTLWCNSLLSLDEISQKLIANTDQNNNTDIYKDSRLFTSRDGLLWMSSENGVYIMDPAKQFFRHHILAPSDITHQGIALMQKDNGIYIGGTGNYFLTLYNASLHQVKQLLPQPKFRTGNGLVAPALLNMVKEDEHHTWLCTENGLLLYDELSNSYRRFAIPGKAAATATKDFITTMLIDSKCNHWIFPWRCGIWTLNATTGKFTKQVTGLMKENGEWKGLVIAAATEDATGNIWFADLDEGLILYEPSTGKFSKPTENKYGARYTLQHVIADAQYVWGVKNDVVFAIDIHTHRLYEWALPAGFNKQVTGFSNDVYHNLWIQTTGGLVLFNTGSHTFKRYTADDGLMETVIKGSLYPLKDGRMLYASHNYITEFDALNMSVAGTMPQVRITGISSQNRVLNAEEKDGRKLIQLDHSYNNFKFTWTVLNYSNPLQNTFYCKLEGVDKDWRFTGYKGEVQYASLLPGKYTLRVKGASADGIMNEAGDSLEIIILPPVWERWWFILLAALMALTLLVLMVRYVSQRNLKERLLKLEKEQAVEKERNRISRDMHDDLGSGLTKIAIMSEVVKKQLYEPEKARTQLENISTSSRELVDNLQDIIWVLNTRYDTLESLAAYVREYALKYFEPTAITLHFNYPPAFPEVRLTEEQRRNIFLVVKETLHNISKHAECNNITISIHAVMHRLKVSITDDGKGFNMNEVRHFGNGLVNMQSRIEQAGGRFTIESSPGKGCNSIIEIGI